MRRYKKQKRKSRWMGLLFLAIVVVSLLVIIKNFPASQYLSFLENFQRGEKTATLEHGWNLILINRDHYIPEDYQFELIELANGEKVDSRIYPDLQNMFDDARAEGLQLFVAAGYRTQEKQQQLLDEKTNAYENEGYSQSEAKQLAERWVALPGTSEHQIGIAVDINADTTYSSSDAVYEWLSKNAYKYGFIQRYPSDKTDITGVINEPWHYRYVGQEAAQEIYALGICLEEYIERLN